ncbi:MAG: hypothetical protein E7357_08325 [Clostridiales bacterium]|nr:hypothetical protein [Clostridiales bacterium]
MQKMVTKMLQNELWWGGTASPASEQAYDSKTVLTLDVALLGNQSAPLYLSSQGRYIWSNSPMTITFDNARLL